MENLIKLHKAQLASDRTSYHSGDRQPGASRATHGRVQADAPRARRDPRILSSPLAKAEFATIPERLVKIGARVISMSELIAAGFAS